MPLPALAALLAGLLRRFDRRDSFDERGANLVEYLLLLMFIALVVLLVLQAFGGKVSAIYSSAESTMP